MYCTLGIPTSKFGGPQPPSAGPGYATACGITINPFLNLSMVTVLSVFWLLYKQSTQVWRGPQKPKGPISVFVLSCKISLRSCFKVWLTLTLQHGRRKDFSNRANSVFFRGSQRDFPGRPKEVKFHFTHLNLNLLTNSQWRQAKAWRTQRLTQKKKKWHTYTQIKQYKQKTCQTVRSY